ncbi:MAG: CopG family transcriptional regulator [Candidatus Bathyarchaeia archaeon]
MRKSVTIRLREEVVEALDELARRNGVSRSLLIKRGIELLLKKAKVEIFVKDRPVKESKTIMKTAKGAEKGILILAPKGM